MGFPAAITGPIALYSNLPINAQYYQPSQFFISTITRGQQTTVTTTADHNFVVGQLVRLHIPSIYALTSNGVQYIIPTCTQLNQTESYVISIPATNQVLLDLDSTKANAFVSSSQPTQPQIVAIGDGNSGNINASGNLSTSNLIPGSYQNISPL